MTQWVALASSFAAMHGGLAFPSFRDRVPNGRRVPCPGGVQGCDAGDSVDCQPMKVCNGLGHASCAGGSLPLNAFGKALKNASFEWTKALCEADSDGDGLTNGQELGDPCCLWRASDIPAKYTQTFSPTHPGFKDEPALVSGYQKPDCVKTTPEKRGIVLGKFNPGEEQLKVELFFDKFAIPEVRTTYVDFALNFPESAFKDPNATYHIVRADTIIDNKKHLHHYVITGCSTRFPDSMHGKPYQGKTANCQIPLGGWAPGRSIFSMPPWIGQPFGPGAGIVALRVNVHYDNPDGEAGAVDSSGLRFWYTATLRNHTLFRLATTQTSRNPLIIVPPGVKRWFLTRRCEVGIKKAGTDIPAELQVWGIGYHAHLLGREMYTEIFLSGNKTPMSLGSEAKWHFDDQELRNVYSAGVTLRTGDVLQTTCVMDASSRKTKTIFGRETTDEMCWQQVAGWSKDGVVEAECKGYLWSGALADGEPGFGIATRHPYIHAPIVLDGSNLLTGGLKIMGNSTSCIDFDPNVCTKMMAQNVKCDFDLGNMHERLKGQTVMDFCCEAVCSSKAGVCKNEQRCEDKVADAAKRSEGNSASPIIWSSKYKLVVPSCSGGQTRFMTLELDVPSSSNATTKAHRATTMASSTSANVAGTSGSDTLSFFKGMAIVVLFSAVVLC
jgi:dopamine beta-monooxygenase